MEAGLVEDRLTEGCHDSIHEPVDVAHFVADLEVLVGVHFLPGGEDLLGLESHPTRCFLGKLVANRVQRGTLERHLEVVERIRADAVVSMRIVRLEVAAVHASELVLDLLDVHEKHAFEELVQALVIRLVQTVFVTLQQL